MQQDNIGRLLLIMAALFILKGTCPAADRVVVIPMGGIVGNATATDVLKGIDEVNVNN